MANDPDRDWERWATRAPYFAVLVDGRYDGEVDEATWQRFMATGEEEIADLFVRLDRLAGAPVRPERAVDFGCGVGRLLVPLARRSDVAIGVDVSPSMRGEAKANLARCDITNAEVVASDDELSALPDAVDLVHSSNVFQHLPVARGLELTARLLDRLRPGGLFALHYAIHVPGWRATAKRVAARSQVLVTAGNLARGRSPSAPMMQMNPYPLPTLLEMLASRGCRDVGIVTSAYRRNRFAFLYGELARSA